MTVKRKIVLALSVAVACLAVAGCAVQRLKDLRVVSAGIERFRPRDGLRDYDVTVRLTLDNPGPEFIATGISGTVRYYGRVMGRFTADPVQVPGKAVSDCLLRGELAVGEDVSLLDVLALAAKNSLDGLTIDVDFRIQLRNTSRMVHLKDMDISQMDTGNEK